MKTLCVKSYVIGHKVTLYGTVLYKDGKSIYLTVYKGSYFSYTEENEVDIGLIYNIWSILNRCVIVMNFIVHESIPRINHPVKHVDHPVYIIFDDDFGQKTHYLCISFSNCIFNDEI